MLEAIFSARAEKKAPAEAKNKATVVNKVKEEPKEMVVKAPAIKLRKRAGTGVGLIKNALTEQESQNADVDIKESYGLGEKLNESFSQAELEEKWEQYLKTLATRPALKSAMVSCPKIIDKTKLLLGVGSKIGEEEISKIKPELLGWLRRELRNSYIEIETELVVRESEGRQLTQSELYAKMQEKNPAFQKFIAKLSLKLDE